MRWASLAGSFAIEIARKTGLPEDIVRSAMDKAGEDHINLEKQLREIARDKRYWAEKRDRIRLTDRKVEHSSSAIRTIYKASSRSVARYWIRHVARLRR